MQSISKQRLGKLVPAEMNAQKQKNSTHTSSSAERLFFGWSMLRSYLEDNWHYS
jgi:hypothetical protein